MIKSYELWCTKTKPPKSIISIDVKFNKSLIFHPTKKLSDIDEENLVSKQVELNYEPSNKIPKTTLHQPVHEKHYKKFSIYILIITYR